MDPTADTRNHELELKKLNRELKRLKKDNELLRIANEQAMHTQAYIQKGSVRQAFYNTLLLATFPHPMIITDTNLKSVMTTDAHFRYSSRYSREDILQGVELSDLLKGLMPPENLNSLLYKCRSVLSGANIEPYIFTNPIHGTEGNWEISIQRMYDSGTVAGLMIAFVNVTEYVEAVEKARAADQAKSNFLANMSHEIRTPMNAISGIAELIIRDSQDQQARHNAMMIKSASSSLLSIINDILDFSRIESGKMELIPDSYRITTLIGDIATMIRIRLEDKPVEFILDIDPSLPRTLYGDMVRVKQILVNMIGNAVKFTEKGSITLSISGRRTADSDCELMISVSDTGIGIREEDQEKIFANFTQVDTTKNRAVEGTGLGLAISRQLIELMGGHIDVKSVYGQGTTFSFTILSQVDDWKPVGNVLEQINEVKVEAFRGTFSAPEATVLIVDDNEMNLEVAEGILAPYHTNLYKATNGPDALRLIEEHSFDIIFLDHMMPVMDGVEVLHRLRRMPKTAGVTVIALTANALSGAYAEYRSLGFNDFLAKPVDPRDMDTMLRRYLNRDLIKPPMDYDQSSPEKDASSGMLPPERTTEVIDRKTGLNYCMNSEGFYSKMLMTFASDDKTSGLQALYDAQDWDEYRIMIHTLKGTSKTIGALGLSEDARKLESAIKEDRIDYVLANHDAFLKEYHYITDLIRSDGIKDQAD